MIVAAPANRQQEVLDLAPTGLELTVTAGGNSRSDSVARALSLCDAELVVVHDAARPLVTAELIDTLVGRLLSEDDAAGVIAAAPVTDTIKRASGADRRVRQTLNRDELWAVHTPQVFRSAALRDAHTAASPALAAVTDDAALVEAAGQTVLIEPAPAENLKVTTPVDLRVAELLLADRKA